MYNNKRYEVNTIIVHVPNGQQIILLKCIFAPFLKQITLFRHLPREGPFVPLWRLVSTCVSLSRRTRRRRVLNGPFVFFLTSIFVHLCEIRSRLLNNINVNDGRTN